MLKLNYFPSPYSIPHIIRVMQLYRKTTRVTSESWATSTFHPIVLIRFVPFGCFLFITKVCLWCKCPLGERFYLILANSLRK